MRRNCAKHLQFFFANLTLDFFVNPPHASMCIRRICKKNPRFFLIFKIFFFTFYFFAQIRRIRRRIRWIYANIFLRNCANCAKIRADLELCALKNHYFAPRIRAFRRLGMYGREGGHTPFRNHSVRFRWLVIGLIKQRRGGAHPIPKWKWEIETTVQVIWFRHLISFWGVTPSLPSLHYTEGGVTLQHEIRWRNQIT